MKMSKRSNGSVIIQVLVVFLVLLGFMALTTDYGLLVYRQRQLQHSADAAALAGAAELHATSDDEAQQQAENNAVANNAEVSNVVINNVGNGQKTIQVDMRATMHTPFAGIMNPKYRTGTVSATATAVSYPAGVAYHLRPWGITIGFFDNSDGPSKVQYNEETTLIVTNIGNEDPNKTSNLQQFVEPVAFSSSNADPSDGSTNFKHYQDAINHGYDQPVTAYQDYTHVYYGQEGNFTSITSATDHALKSDDSIFSQANGHDYSSDEYMHPSYDNPHLIFLPIINHMVGDESGKLVCSIYGFAAFYLEGYDNGKLTGRFIKYTLPNDPKGSLGNAPGYTPPDTGTYRVHLIK